jgi:transcriptional regulator with XRE-family HTH domain
MLDRNITVLALERQKRGLTQADVAHAIGIPQSRVSDFEHGLRPTAEQLRALCTLFDVPESLDYLLLERVQSPLEVPAPPDMKERIRAMAAAREKKQ